MNAVGYVIYDPVDDTYYSAHWRWLYNFSKDFNDATVFSDLEKAVNCLSYDATRHKILSLELNFLERDEGV